jgi:membrane protein DedA with SNARE-associated domain
MISQFIQSFFEYAFQFSTWVINLLGYPGIVVLMAIESACIPLPSEVIMPLAGYLVTQGRFDLYWAATAGAIGCNVGSVVAYEIGYFGGRPLVERYGSYILMSRHDVEMADKFFKRYGAAAVFIGRLMPIVRTFIALPAGIARMPRIPFHVYTFLGSWPWCFGLAWVGMKIGEEDNWKKISAFLLPYKIPIAILILAAVIWFFWTHWKYRMRVSGQSV